VNETFKRLIETCRAGSPVALGLIAAVSGSGPQVAGAAALFSPEGLQAGTLGGGVLEAEAEKRAREAMVRREVRLLALDLLADIEDDQGAACGGRVTVLIDGRPAESLKIFEALQADSAARRPGVLSARVVSGNPLGLKWRWKSGWEGADGDPDPEVKQAIRIGVPVWGRRPGGWILALPFFPRCRLVIVGAGHVGRALSRLGRWLEFEVTVIDDRAEFTGRERLPDADRIIQADIPEALREFPVGPDTFLVIATRGHSQDIQALRACVARDAAYLGMMASTRHVELIRQRFLEQEWATPEQWARLHAPIGLPIGSKSVQEIAVSIAAQLVEVRSGLARGGTALP
jgi:xanthine dehydrogenase accessory factor